MKKKGFTLVELLAVIAILAILVIIALPNVMSLFNEAKKNSFNNELKEIYKTAQNQWMTDSMIETKELNYSRDTSLQCDGATANKALQLSGRTQLQYGITVNKAGKVTSYVATDGTFLYHYTATATDTEGLKIEDIGTASPDEISTGNAIITLSEKNQSSATISCAGTSGFTYTTSN